MPDPSRIGGDNMTVDIPSAAKTLLKKLDGWSVQANPGTGDCEFGGLSEETNGEGKRHRVSSVETVDSYLVRATHVDGRAFVAIWMRRRSVTPAGKPRGWSLDTCWRARGIHEFTPHQLTATDLAAYVAPVLALERAA